MLDNKTFRCQKRQNVLPEIQHNAQGRKIIPISAENFAKSFNYKRRNPVL